MQSGTRNEHTLRPEGRSGQQNFNRHATMPTLLPPTARSTFDTCQLVPAGEPGGGGVATSSSTVTRGPETHATPHTQS